MRKFFILLITIPMVSCITQKKQLEIFNFKSEQGDIIYEGITNSVFYEKWPNEELNIEFKAISGCLIENKKYYLNVTPTENSQNAIIEVKFSEQLSKKYILKVKPLPEPRLYYNIDSTPEKQKLKNSYSKKELEHLLYFEALSEIGNLSWVSYEIEKYEIIILRDSNVIYRNSNNGEKMTEENKNIFLSLNKGDIVLFRNIEITQNGKKMDSFNEKSITIE